MEVFQMKSNRGFIVGMSNEHIKKLIESISLKAFADEGEDGGEGEQSKSTPSINYEDLIAKARREEKDKHYKTIEKLKTQVSTLTEQHNNDLLKIADLEKKLAEANDKLSKAGSGDSEEVKTLRDTIKNLNKEKEDLDKKVKDLEANKPVDREEVVTQVRAELEAEYEVKTYKATKLAELKDDILVPELVFGNTKEEIDESIKTALERSASIKESLGIKNQTKQKRTPKSPTNPSVSGVQDNGVSIERLASMDVRSPEYAEMRKQLGLR